MPAANLESAADQCATTMFLRYLAGTLKTNLTAFATALTVTSNVFPDSNPKLREAGNWFILIQALTADFTGHVPPQLDDQQVTSIAIGYLYRFLWQCVQLADHDAATFAPLNVTVLAAFNANLA